MGWVLVVVPAIGTFVKEPFTILKGSFSSVKVTFTTPKVTFTELTGDYRFSSQPMPRTRLVRVKLSLTSGSREVTRS